MSSHIGTNFLFKSNRFLDDRQGVAKTKQDLKDWNIPVPEGFKICLDSIWYYYDSGKTLEDTGHWIPEICNTEESSIDPNKQTVSMSLISNINEDFNRDLSNIKEEINNINNDIDVIVDNINESPLSLINPVITSAFCNNDTDRQELEAIKEELIENLNNAIIQNDYQKELDKNHDGRLDTSDITEWNNFFDEINKSLNYLLGNNTGTYQLEVGSSILPEITWRIVLPKISWSLSGTNIVWKLVPESIKNNIIPESSSVTNNDNIEGIIKPDDKGIMHWISKDIVTSNNVETKKFTIESSDGKLTTEGVVYIKFRYKTYTGSDTIDFWNKDTLTERDLNSSFTSRFVESGTLSKTSFNCAGGKYPYILVPKQFYRSSYKTFVNGNLNSDFEKKEVIFTNNRGVKINYVIYKTSVIQTGSNINIEIRN